MNPNPGGPCPLLCVNKTPQGYCKTTACVNNTAWASKGVKYEVIVAAIPVDWIKQWMKWAEGSLKPGRYLGIVSQMLRDWEDGVNVESDRP